MKAKKLPSESGSQLEVTDKSDQSGGALMLMPPEEQMERLFSMVRDQFQLCSLNLRRPEDQQLLIEVANGEWPTARELANKIIEIEHVVSSRVHRELVDGEVEEWTRIALVSPSRDIVIAGSAGISQSLSLLMLGWGLPPYRPAKRVTVRIKALDGGKQWLWLSPATKD